MRSIVRKHARHVMVCLALTSAATAQEVQFSGIGDLRGGALGWYSEATGVSGDGSLVVGFSSGTWSGHGWYSAVRWTREEGMVLLPSYGGFESYAFACSADGQVAVGLVVNREGWAQAAVWQLEGSAGLGRLITLGDLGGRPWPSSSAGGISADGGVVVGGAAYGRGKNSRAQAFRWTWPAGMRGLGVLKGLDSHAYAVSADGTVVVGWSDSWSRYRDGEAFRWQDGHMEGLGVLSGGHMSVAYGVSADGQVVVGWSEGEPGRSGAFRWTRESGMVPLGPSADGKQTAGTALAASGDGSLIVGFGGYEGHSEVEAFIWDAERGTRNLTRVLVDDYGVVLGPWRLEEATAISADGLTIVGNGYHYGWGWEGWVVRLTPDPRAPQRRW